MIQLNKTYMTLSDEKQFALEVLDIFDELARPEIKNRIMKQIWYGWELLHFQGVYKWMQGLIIKKPDAELNAKMLLIYRKLGQRFRDLDNSVEINTMEQLNPGVKIPPVGELNKVKNLTKINKVQAQELSKEIF